jgi:threonine dehydrogenase-like Zn-dependent dehydrogenase
MRAVRCEAHAVAVVDVPRPEGEGIPVTIRSAGICGSDLHLLASDFPTPHVLGHEMAGTTPDGTPVAIEPLRPCGQCDPCREGRYNICVLGSRILIGMGHDGGMAEEVRVPERCLVPLAAGATPENACLVEPLAVAVHGLRRSGLRAARAVVIGGGTIGLCVVAAAADAGFDTTLVARHEAQIEAGARLGAGIGAEGTYDLVVDAAGTRAALEDAVALCRPGATLLLVASYWDGLLELPGLALCMKEVNVVPASMYAREGESRDIDVAAGLLARRPEIADVLITHRFPLEAAPEAFAAAADRKSGAIKVVLDPWR